MSPPCDYGEFRLAIPRGISESGDRSRPGADRSSETDSGGMADKPGTSQNGGDRRITHRNEVAGFPLNNKGGNEMRADGRFAITTDGCDS